MMSLWIYWVMHRGFARSFAQRHAKEMIVIHGVGSLKRHGYNRNMLKVGIVMTNREWLIWQLIDMSDEEFAEGICGNGELWSCDDCRRHGVNDHGCTGCEEKFHAWLKQEHKGDGNESI
jgi:predicted RNA-binding Zn-ribbon protein involved in translation (DUF1610 family)